MSTKQIALSTLIVLLLFVGWSFYRFGQSEIALASYSVQQAALKELVGLQEAYFEADHDGDGQPDSVYADVLGKLPAFAPDVGIRVTLLHGGRTGWAASTSYTKHDGEGCALWVGFVPVRTTTPGGRSVEEPEVVYCDR